MNEFESTGKNLGEGKLRSFFEVKLSAGEEETYYAATRPVLMWKERFVQSAEFELARSIQESSLKRENHRLILPLAFKKVTLTETNSPYLKTPVPKELFSDEDLTQIEIYYPQIADGRNLLDVITKSRYENAISYLPIKRVLTIIQDIATGIDTMSEFNFVSNDIKMSNILVEMNRAWVADFNVGMISNDNTVDRKQFFHLVQMLLIGREIDKLFLSNRPKCTKENFIQGLRTLDNISPSIETDHILDTDGTVRRMMLANYSDDVQLLIDKYSQNSKLPLVDFSKELTDILGSS